MAKIMTGGSIPNEQMRIELLTSEKQRGHTCYYEFWPGPYYQAHSSEDSVFVDWNTFELIAMVFVDNVLEFAPYGPTTISGGRIRQLVDALRHFAERVEQADTPDAVWDPADRLVAPAKIEDWPVAKAQLCSLLRDLADWMLDVEARREPVTILGL